MTRDTNDPRQSCLVHYFFPDEVGRCALGGSEEVRANRVAPGWVLDKASTSNWVMAWCGLDFDIQVLSGLLRHCEHCREEFADHVLPL